MTEMIKDIVILAFFSFILGGSVLMIWRMIDKALPPPLPKPKARPELPKLPEPPDLPQESDAPKKAAPPRGSGNLPLRFQAVEK